MFRGDVLRKNREMKNYTLKGLSDALKEKYGRYIVNFTTLSQWETNPKAAPRKKNLLIVADFLGLSLNDLYDDEPEIISDEMKVDIISIIAKMIRLYYENPQDERLFQIQTLIM